MALNYKSPREPEAWAEQAISAKWRRAFPDFEATVALLVSIRTTAT
jgi:hypothetical protein